MGEVSSANGGATVDTYGTYFFAGKLQARRNQKGLDTVSEQ